MLVLKLILSFFFSTLKTDVAKFIIKLNEVIDFYDLMISINFVMNIIVIKFREYKSTNRLNYNQNKKKLKIYLINFLKIINHIRVYIPT